MILNGAENGKHIGMILIHLQKAFDTLYHKMKSLGCLDDIEMVSLVSHKHSFFRFIRQSFRKQGP